MKTNLKQKVIALAFACGISTVTYASPITGSIDMSGTVTLNNTSLALATSATSVSGVTVQAPVTGSYSGVPIDTAVTFSPFSWTSFMPVSPLWSFNAGGQIYQFELQSISVVEQTTSLLQLTGTGLLMITGGQYDPTLGNWSFSVNSANATDRGSFSFKFGQSQTSAVPDSGTTVMLLGAGLSGLGLIRKKMFTA